MADIWPDAAGVALESVVPARECLPPLRVSILPSVALLRALGRFTNW